MLSDANTEQQGKKKFKFSPPAYQNKCLMLQKQKFFAI